MSNNTHEINKAIITKRSKNPIIVSNMDGVLVNKTINASIDNANIIGKVHQYSIKNRFIAITSILIYLNSQLLSSSPEYFANQPFLPIAANPYVFPMETICSDI